MQIKVTARYYLTPVRMAIIKKTKKKKKKTEQMLSRMWRKGNPCALADKNVNWGRHYGKQYGIPQKN